MEISICPVHKLWKYGVSNHNHLLVVVDEKETGEHQARAIDS